MDISFFKPHWLYSTTYDDNIVAFYNKDTGTNLWRYFMISQQDFCAVAPAIKNNITYEAFIDLINKKSISNMDFKVGDCVTGNGQSGIVTAVGENKILVKTFHKNREECSFHKQNMKKTHVKPVVYIRSKDELENMDGCPDIPFFYNGSGKLKLHKDYITLEKLRSLLLHSPEENKDKIQFVINLLDSER